MDTDTGESEYGKSHTVAGNRNSIDELKEQIIKLKDENKEYMEQITKQLEAKVDKMIDWRLKEISDTVANNVAAKLTRRMKAFFANKNVSVPTSGEDDLVLPEDDTDDPLSTSVEVTQTEERRNIRVDTHTSSQDMLTELNNIKNKIKQNCTSQDPNHDIKFSGSSAIK